MVSWDLERTSLRLADVEARNEQLRLELAHAASQSPAGQPTYTAEDDPTFLRMRSENASLIRKVDAARMEKESHARNLESKIRLLEREIAQMQGRAGHSRGKLQRWSDYDEMRRELDMLKV